MAARKEHQVLTAGFSGVTIAVTVHTLGPGFWCRSGRSKGKGGVWYGSQEHSSKHCLTCKGQIQTPVLNQPLFKKYSKQQEKECYTFLLFSRGNMLCYK